MRLSENIGLPYSQTGHVQYETGTNISQANINNTFIQLVDNDLYIENKLANDYEYLIGPKVYNKDVVDAADNGYKTWGSFNSAELSILHKEELDIQQSLTKLFSAKCNFLLHYEDQYYAGTEDGLLFADDYTGTWRILSSKKCNNYCYNDGNNVLLFAFDDGIYQLRLSSSGKKLLLKITESTYDCSFVLFRPDDQLLIVAAENKLYYAYYMTYDIAFDNFDTNYESIKLLPLDIYDEDYNIQDGIIVNAMANVSTGELPLSKSIFCGADDGISQLSSVDDYVNYKTLKPNYSYTCAISFNNALYFGTADNGVVEYNIETDTIAKHAIASGNTTQLVEFNNTIYACVDGSLYVNFHKIALKTPEDVEISNIQKIAFIGNNSMYVLVALAGEDKDKLYYTFGENYKNMVQFSTAPYIIDKIYDICSIHEAMTLDVAARITVGSNHRRTILRIQFPRIEKLLSDDINELEILKNGESPAYISKNNANAIKILRTPAGNTYTVTKNLIYKNSNYSEPCSFLKANGQLATINDVIYLQDKQSFVVLLDDAQISAIPENFDTADQPTELEFIGPMAESMKKYGLNGAYSYVEIGNYAFIVTKQDADAQNKDCDTEITNKNKSKYFIAYVDKNEAGEDCSFLKSPVTLDQPTTLLGTFSQPPSLYVKNEKLVVFDKENKKISGVLSIKQQLFQYTNKFFNIYSDSYYIQRVFDIKVVENYVLVCAQLIAKQNASDIKNGIFLNRIDSVKRVAAEMYQPIYEKVNNADTYKQLIVGNIFKLCIDGETAYVCSDAGLFKLELQTLVSLESVNINELKNNKNVEELLNIAVNDADVYNGNIIAATNTGLALVTHKDIYSVLNAFYIQDVTQSDNNVQLVFSRNNDTYFQLINNYADQSVVYSYYSKQGTAYKQNSTGKIADVQLNANSFEYCCKYYNDEIDKPFDAANDFIATLDNQTSNISAIYATDEYAEPTLKNAYSDQNIKCITTSQYEDDSLVDSRFIIASTSAGDLSSIYISTKDAEPIITNLQHEPNAQLTNVLFVGSRFRQDLNENNYQEVYQITSNKVFISRYAISKENDSYTYDDTIATYTYNLLPAGLSLVQTSKCKIIDSVLYVLVGNTLHIIDLDTQKTTGETLDEYLVQSVEDVYFSYNTVIIQQTLDAEPQFSIVYENGDTVPFAFGAAVSGSYMQQIGELLFISKYPQPNQCSTEIYRQSNSKIVNFLTHEKTSSIISKPYYQSQANDYDVYVLQYNGDPQHQNVVAYKIDFANATVEAQTSIYENAKFLYMQNDQLYFTANTNENGNIIEKISYSSNQFSTSITTYIDDILTTQSGTLNYFNLIPFTDAVATVRIENSSNAAIRCNLVNAILGIKNSYSDSYIQTKNLQNVWCILSQFGQYIAHNDGPTAENNNICLLNDNSIITNNKLIALKFSSNNTLKWLEVTDDISLHETTVQTETVGGKLVTAIVDQANFTSIEKIFCQSKYQCFVYGSIDGVGHWWYIYTHAQNYADNQQNEAKELKLEFKNTGIKWIDDTENKKINYVVESKNIPVFCTNVGVWQAEFFQQYSFDDNTSFVFNRLDAAGENILNSMAENDYNVWLYRQDRNKINTIAKVQHKNTEICFDAFLISQTVKNNESQLNIENLLLDVDNDIKQLFIVKNSTRYELFYVAEVDNVDVLYNTFGIKTSIINDKRNSSAAVLLANNMEHIDSQYYVLGNSNLDVKNSFTFKSFKKNKLCFKKQNQHLANKKITFLKQYEKATYFIGYIDNNSSYINTIELDKIESPTPLNEPLYQKDDDAIGAQSLYVTVQNSSLNIPTYYFSVGNEVLVVQQLTTTTSWKTLFTADVTTKINDIYVKSAKDIVVATEDGLYYTYSKYELVNDIQKLNPNDVLDLFYKNITTVDATYQSMLNSHKAHRHSPGSVLTRINNDIMDVRFSNIAEDWIQYDINSDETIIYNDLVAEVKFGEVNVSEEKTDDTIRVDTYNTVCIANNVDLNYIMKRWMSGYTEIYINLPTTNTYYLNHILGTPNCTTNPDEKIERKNLDSLSALTLEQKKLNGQLSAQCTHIELLLEKQQYSIDELLETTINGSSLPLKIYRDNVDQHYDTESSRLYQSYILPSVVENVDLTQSDYYHFYFACFGTDAQSIKIAFNDRINVYGNKFFTIEFNSNGGAGKMQSQKISIDQTVKLRKNTHLYKDSNAFLGWSLKATVDSMAEPMFLDGQNISKVDLENAVENLKILPGATITLFAVWEKYTLPADDTDYTIFTIECKNKAQMFSAMNKYEFDETVLPLNMAVVDYGD